MLVALKINCGKFVLLILSWIMFFTRAGAVSELIPDCLVYLIDPFVQVELGAIVDKRS